VLTDFFRSVPRRGYHFSFVLMAVSVLLKGLAFSPSFLPLACSVSWFQFFFFPVSSLFFCKLRRSLVCSPFPCVNRGFFHHLFFEPSHTNGFCNFLSFPSFLFFSFAFRLCAPQLSKSGFGIPPPLMGFLMPLPVRLVAFASCVFFFIPNFWTPQSSVTIV